MPRAIDWPVAGMITLFFDSLSRYRLTQKDLKTLRPRTWLNDEVVNAFLWLIDDEQPKVFAHTTFFLTTFMGNRG